jgi:hypothetical protein
MPAPRTCATYPSAPREDHAIEVVGIDTCMQEIFASDVGLLYLSCPSLRPWNIHNQAERRTRRLRVTLSEGASGELIRVPISAFFWVSFIWFAMVWSAVGNELANDRDS